MTRGASLLSMCRSLQLRAPKHRHISGHQISPLSFPHATQNMVYPKWRPSSIMKTSMLSSSCHLGAPKCSSVLLHIRQQSHCPPTANSKIIIILISPFLLLSPLNQSLSKCLPVPTHIFSPNATSCSPCINQSVKFVILTNPLIGVRDNFKNANLLSSLQFKSL